MITRKLPSSLLYSFPATLIFILCSLVLFSPVRADSVPGPEPAAAAGPSGHVARADDESDDDEEIIFGEEEEEKEYPSKSLRAENKLRQWEGRVNLGGYWENEAGFDTRQENPDEDMIDFRSKIFAYGSYAFSDRARVNLSILTLYWILEGGKDRQQTSFDLYEGYLAFKFPKADLYAGQMLVHWGACDLLSPTDSINPVNYRNFIDPDTEDLRIPLPMIKTDFFLDNWTIELVYIPIFQSAIFEIAGSDLSLVQNSGDNFNLPAALDPILQRTLDNYPAQAMDVQEQKFVMGEAAVKIAYDTGGAWVELVYFSTRDDFPAVLYTEARDITDPASEGSLQFEFDRYEMYGVTFKKNFGGVDLFAEYAYSPKRTLTIWLDIEDPPDGIINKTRRERRPWQAAAIELDYLDPEGNYYLKLGAERISFINPPDHLFLSSGEVTYFLALFRLYTARGNIVPEWRLINIQSGSNQWFISPRVAFKFRRDFELVTGLNIYTGSGGGSSSTSSREFAPITVLSDNNQVFFSLRWSF